MLQNEKLKQKLEYFNARLQLVSWKLGKADYMQKFCKRDSRSSKIFGQKSQ